MMYVSDEKIDQLIMEDVPYMDLTTWSLGIGEQAGSIAYFTREDAVLCGTEEVLRILQKLNINVEVSCPSGSKIKAGDVFLRGKGRAAELHMAWKVCQNIFDHCSGIATKTQKMVAAAKAVNPAIAIVSTRKGFPGTKALSVKAVMAGGGSPHRMGISETVLVFKQHMNFLGGIEGFIKAIPEMKQLICEKKLIVEADSMEEAFLLCQNGVDGLQFDKVSAQELREQVPKLRQLNPGMTLFAAGGITDKNVADYANTGVDALVTTCLYSAKPIDVGVRIKPLSMN